jgi:hypothetical protein
MVLDEDSECYWSGPRMDYSRSFDNLRDLHFGPDLPTYEEKPQTAKARSALQQLLWFNTEIHG